MADRDAKGHFLKGHRHFRSQRGLRTGRKPSIATEVRDALAVAERALPGIIDDMIKRAKDPDVPDSVRQAAAEYLCDRVYGRPNLPLSNAGRTPIASFTFVLPDGSQATAKALLEEPLDDSHQD